MKISTYIRAARKAAEIADSAFADGSLQGARVGINKLAQSEQLFDYAIKRADALQASDEMRDELPEYDAEIEFAKDVAATSAAWIAGDVPAQGVN